MSAPIHKPDPAPAKADPGPRPPMPAFLGLPDNPAMLRLKALPQWLVWNYSLNKARTKWTKPPRSPFTGEQIAGNNAANLSDYATAAAYASSTPNYGIGFSLMPGDGIRFDDLDDVIDPATGAPIIDPATGEPLFPWVAEIIRLQETYIEYSVSGGGLHILSDGKLPKAIKKDSAHVESYSSDRFLTFTGRPVYGCPLEIRPSPRTLELLQAQVARVEAEEAARKAAEAEEARKAAEGRSEGIAANFAAYAATLDRIPSKDQPFWRAVNQAAMDDLAAWVPSLFPNAVYQPGPRSYRVTSAKLGRNLEEDLAIAPNGIRDWGTERSYSPTFLVLEFGGAPNMKGAAFWLCDRLGKSPADLGWSENTSRSAAKAERAEQIEQKRAPWLKGAIRSSSGEPIANLANTLLGLREAPELAEVFAYDMMLERTILAAPIPSSTGRPVLVEEPRPVRDTDVSALQEYLQHAGLPRIGKDVIHQAVDARAVERSFHPVREYLDALKWDGVQRLDTWLTTYAGVEDTPYARGIGGMFIVSTVARIFSPGCKVDYMLVLEGAQGDRKSMVCSVLADKWFSDALPDIETKDASQHLAGRWIIEVAEMHAMSKAENQLLKKFINRQVERYRPPYGRNDIDQPRQCVFIGTTNKYQYLRDETGGRRFWPVKVGRINIEQLTLDRDQLFAEAVRLYRTGFQFWPDEEFERTHIKPQQDARYEVDVWEENVSAYLVGRDRVLVSEILHVGIGLETQRTSRADQKRVTDVLEHIGWMRLKKDRRGNIPWGPSPELLAQMAADGVTEVPAAPPIERKSNF